MQYYCTQSFNRCIISVIKTCEEYYKVRKAQIHHRSTMTKNIKYAAFYHLLGSYNVGYEYNPAIKSIFRVWMMSHVKSMGNNMNTIRYMFIKYELHGLAITCINKHTQYTWRGVFHCQYLDMMAG